MAESTLRLPVDPIRMVGTAIQRITLHLSNASNTRPSIEALEDAADHAAMTAAYAEFNRTGETVSEEEAWSRLGLSDL